MMVRDGAVIPHIKLAQSTDKIDWSNIDLVSFSSNGIAKGKICLPTEQKLYDISVSKKGKTTVLDKDPTNGKVKWAVKNYTER
jgi:alpha-D-xyloside xylohydrolase